MFQLYRETLEGHKTKQTAAAHLLSILCLQTPDVGHCTHVQTKCCHLTAKLPGFQEVAALFFHFPVSGNTMTVLTTGKKGEKEIAGSTTVRLSAVWRLRYLSSCRDDTLSEKEKWNTRKCE